MLVSALLHDLIYLPDNLNLLRSIHASKNWNDDKQAVNIFQNYHAVNHAV